MFERRLLTLWLVLLLAACTGQPQPEGKMTPMPSAQTLVYECGEFEFVVRTGPGEVALYLPDDYRVLGQVRSASGAKFQDGDIVFWSKGDEALLDVGDKHYRGCALNRARGPWEEARRRGVNFRAIGQEPGWSLEIHHDGNMLLIADYGKQRILLPTPEPEPTEDGERYVAENASHRLEVDIQLDHCTDSMSGDAFSNTVTLLLDGRELRGCGESLDQPWE